MTDFLCPVCGSPLKTDTGSYKCSAGHCYDIARRGYVNLLQNYSSGHHGDDRLMVRARTEFLNKGYYNPLSDAITSLLAESISDGACIIDAGCGDGKYTADLEQKLFTQNKQAEIIGFDISKYALDALARRSRTIRTAVAGTSSMPLPDHCADAVMNIFSPFFPDEFHRVLKEKGLLLRVIPLEKHLFELKQAIYDVPYLNDIPAPDVTGFRLNQTKDICYSVHINNNEDLTSLFQMTPYYYKTSSTDQEKLSQISSLDISLQFRILVYCTL